jgi:transketolase
MVKVSAAALKKYKEIAKSVRKQILQMHARSASSHIGSSLSVTDILVALYFHALKISPDNWKDGKRDRLVLSKGHAASALYAVLAEKGFFAKGLLEGYCLDAGELPGHVTLGCVPAIEASSGSLGHGLPMAVGMALAARHDRNKYRVFAVLSDGECQEGSVWEAAMFAAQYKLDNLVAIIDYNKIQAFGRIRDVVGLEPFVEKWRSFGWSVRKIDGHNLGQVICALEAAPFTRRKPSVVIADTVKGKGVSFMENSIAWHYKSPNRQELEAALLELDSQ